jgi:hypothetical protein
MPIEWLVGTPFSNYLVPGLVLFIFNGLGNLTGGILTSLKLRHSPEVAIFFGIIMMIWIISQIGWFGYQSFLQPLYFTTGLAQVLLGYVVKKKFRKNPN